MEALILLLISVSLVTTYGFIYVASRIIREKRKGKSDPFFQAFFYLLFISLISASGAAFFLTYP